MKLGSRTTTSANAFFGTSMPSSQVVRRPLPASASTSAQCIGL